MLKSSNSSQSSAPTQYNVGNGGVMVCGGRWDQVDNNNMLQNTKPLEWNELPPHSVVSANVSSEYHVATSVNNVNVNKVNANNINNSNNMNNGSNVNIISNQVVYPPNYMNVPYQRNGGSNGYISLNPTNHPPQIINGQNFLPTQNGQIIGGPGWPNQSDHGRFISQHQSPHQPGWTCKKTTGVKKQKRIRTAFTTQQMMDLEQEYARSRYLDRARRLQLADLLRLNERTIKIWFQNRRMKEKKDKAETMEEAVVASSSVSSPIQMPMLIHEQYPAITNEVYHQGNIYVGQYPVTSTPISMPATSLPTSTAVQSSAQNMYENFMSEECREQYQQVPSYQSSYTAPQELSAEVEPKAGPSTSSAPSGIVENSWDMSWLRLDNDEEGLSEFNFK